VRHSLRNLERRLDHLAGGPLLALAACGVLVVGGVDYLTGYDVSMSVFYLAPVALAAWYGGRPAGFLIAALSCASWFVADLAAGHRYASPFIPVWNALVRLTFFVITAMLLTALRRSLRDQQLLARTDSLTGLCSRRVFEERLVHDLALADRRNGMLTLAYVDIDDFGRVNETYGHAGGDRVLRLIGRVFGESLREADTAARLGGDEFALVLPDTDGDGARQTVAKLEQELRKAFAASHLEVTCSIGVVTLMDPTISAERAIAAADEAMYQVKQAGKGAVRFDVVGQASPPHAAADAPHASRR
jgi:diguanylate cyclase (GGDEF)-like protein